MGFERGFRGMRNIIDIEGYKALIHFHAESGMFRGEFLGLNGGGYFCGSSVETLAEEGRKSLRAYLDMCREKGIVPVKTYSGRFNVRLRPDVHEAAVIAAAAEAKSLNEWVAGAIENAARGAGEKR